MSTPTFPKFVYNGGASELIFEEYPFVIEEPLRASSFEDHIDEVIPPSTIQFIPQHLYTLDHFLFDLQFFTKAKNEEMWTWWNAIKWGASWQFYPDKDVTSFYTLKISDFEFAPKQVNGFFFYKILTELAA